MRTALRLADTALLAGAGCLGAMLLQAQGHAEIGLAPLLAGLAGAWLGWSAG